MVYMPWSCNINELDGFQETHRLTAEPVPGIEAVPDDSNARYFHVVVAGPKEVSPILSH